MSVLAFLAFLAFPSYAGSTTVSSDVLAPTSSTGSTCVYTTLRGQAVMPSLLLLLLLPSHLTKKIRISSGGCTQCS